MKRTTNWILVAVAAAAALNAQDRLAGPVAGYVYDAGARALRPVVGIPGASLLGDALDLGYAVEAAQVAPRQDTALVVGDGGARFVRLGASGAAALICEGLAAAPEGVAYSPSGSAAAVYAAGRVQIVAGLPDAPHIAGAVSIGAVQRRSSRFAVGRIRLSALPLAVSDDGRYVLASSGGSIRLSGIAGENFSVMEGGTGALIAFAPGGHDAAVADAAGVAVVRDVAGAGVRRVLASADPGARPAAGLAFSGDGRKLLLAAGGSIAVFNVETGERGDIDCGCEATTLLPMGGWFRLNEAGAAPLWLLDVRTDEARVVFVPARAE